MNGLIHCYGCNAQIHVSAVACPQCGAPAQAPVGTLQMPAAPAVAVSNTVVWFLAFAPLIGWLLEGVVAYMLNSESELAAQYAWNSRSYWFITIGLNIGLSVRDELVLKKAGIDTQTFKGMTWLVPVYLFQRAKMLGHGNGYFITWIVCFVFWSLSSLV